MQDDDLSLEIVMHYLIDDSADDSYVYIGEKCRVATHNCSVVQCLLIYTYLPACNILMGYTHELN